MAAFHGPHLLILDEPTNHLDVDSREALIHALNDYEGAVILISHDRHLIEASVDRLWLVDDGTVRTYDEDIAAYRAMCLSLKGSPGKDSVTSTPSSNERSQANRQEERRVAAERRAELAPLRRQVKALEKDMEALTSKLAKADALLGNPTLYQEQPEKAKEIARLRGILARQLEDVEAAWLTSCEEIESFEGAAP